MSFPLLWLPELSYLILVILLPSICCLIILCFSFVCINYWLLGNHIIINLVALNKKRFSSQLRNPDVACLGLQLQQLAQGCSQRSVGVSQGQSVTWGSEGEGSSSRYKWFLAAYRSLRIAGLAGCHWRPPLSAGHMDGQFVPSEPTVSISRKPAFRKMGVISYVV